MVFLKVARARANFHRLLDNLEATGPVCIAGSRSNAVLVSETEWDGIQETLYLLSVSGMRASLVDGLNTPASKMAAKLCW